jgi:hypothetical protein
LDSAANVLVNGDVKMRGNRFDDGWIFCPEELG